MKLTILVDGKEIDDFDVRNTDPERVSYRLNAENLDETHSLRNFYSAIEKHGSKGAIIFSQKEEYQRAEVISPTWISFRYRPLNLDLKKTIEP